MSFFKKKNKKENTPDSTINGAKSSFDKDDCTLKLDNIVKVYGDGDNKVTALKGVSLSFRRNEFVSVLGPSGCGKTTLLNIIGGLDRYTSGDLIINGKSTKEYVDSDWDTYRNNSIGFVFQNYNLIPHQNVLHNVELALTLSGVTKEERKQLAEQALEKVGLKGLGYKLPNQLSGGQMQRVAIARALVNNPEIILADEPTGALDTETSIQVLDLLKEVAKDRLVIMVTHNPILAEQYSTRIIKLLDGEKTDDSDPYLGEEKFAKENNGKGRAHMKLSTAFALSLSNLRTKRGRTILTSIAGSIGIIGIALVLAVSTGFSGYINKLQADTLSVYPVTVSEASIDLTDFNKLSEKTNLEKFPTIKEVITKKAFANLTNMLKSNRITDEYIAYVNDFVNSENEKAKNTAEKWRYTVKESYGLDMNNFIMANLEYNVTPSEMMSVKRVVSVETLVNGIEDVFGGLMDKGGIKISTGFIRSYIPTVMEMPDNYDLLNAQYDVLEGKWATNDNEVMVIVDEYNQIPDITLALLGFKALSKIETVDNQINVVFKDADIPMSFESVMAKKFYVIDNDDRFVKNETGSTETSVKYDERFFKDETELPANKKELSVAGIIRLKEGVSQGVLDPGIAYTHKLVETVISRNENSQIVNDAKTADSGNVEVTTFFQKVIKDINVKRDFSARDLAGSKTVSKLSIYSVGYQAKEDLKKYLDDWNTGKEKEDEVHYSDSTALLFSALNSIVDAVKIVLISFTAISLIVSSIMIGIITYVSVVERTKEIGVLRSIGARKKDISRIFNAETFLIGLFAGLIGVGVTYLLSIPINLIFASLITNAGAISALKVTDALILVAVSFVLTLIAGLFPSRLAAKKDPVVALRSE